MDSTEFQDWELLHNSGSASVVLVNSPKSDDNNTSTDFQEIEAESAGMIRSDYFSLDNQTRNSPVDADVSEEEGSVESDNPSWIDPAGSEARYQRKNSGEFWSDSGSDRSDDHKFSDFDVKNDLGFVENSETRMGFEGIMAKSEKAVNFSEFDEKKELGFVDNSESFEGIEAKSEKAMKFSEFDVKNELGLVESEKTHVGFEGFGGIHVEGKNLGKFWSYSGGDGLVSMKFSDVGNETEVAFADHLKERDESIICSEMDGRDGSITEFEAGDGQSSGTESADVEEIKPKGTSDGEMNKVMWWKVPLDVMKYCLFKVSPVWSFSMAAAVMGIVILGRRLYKMKQKTRGLELKLAVDDKKVSQFMNRVARLNEAFSVGRRVPIIRSSLPAAGLNPSWPVISLR
jgi:hypothetical protein